MTELLLVHTSGTRGYSTNICKKCQLPYIYVGDVIGNPRDLFCHCKQFENLLEWSLTEYADIWEALAEYDKTGRLPELEGEAIGGGG